MKRVADVFFYRGMILAVSLLLFGLLGCGPSSSSMEEPSSTEGSRGREARAPGAPLSEAAPVADMVLQTKADAKKTRAAGGQPPDDATPSIQIRPGFVPSAVSDERLLEYKLHLSYRARDFTKARATLLAVVGRRGFLGETSTSIDDRAVMHTNFAVRASELTEVLKDLEGIGELRSERITVSDHTEPFVKEQRLANREEIRTKRKAGISSGALVAKNWAERNRALENSENQLDRALHEQWKLQDRARWARVSVELLGPETAPAVVVPPYQRALVGLVNLGLDISYLLLWLSPLLLLGLVLWVLRRRLEQLLGRLRRRESAA